MGVVMGVFVILLNTVVAPCLSMSHDPEKKDTMLMFMLVENMHNNKRKGHLNQKENCVIMVDVEIIFFS